MSKHVMRIHPRGLHRHGAHGFGGPFDINFIASTLPNVAPTSSTKSATFMVSAPRETMSAAPTSSTKSATFLVSAPASSASTSKTTPDKASSFDFSALPGGSNWTPDTTLRRAQNRAEEARESASTPDVQVGEGGLPVPAQDVVLDTQDMRTERGIVDGESRVVSSNGWYAPKKPYKILGLPWWQTALIGIGAFSVGIFAIRALR